MNKGYELTMDLFNSQYLLSTYYILGTMLKATPMVNKYVNKSIKGMQMKTKATFHPSVMFSQG